jgi:hypothetical protein
MAGFDQILYVGIVGVGLYFAWTSGLLDKAGQGIVDATAPKGGFAKHHKKVRIIEPLPVIIEQPIPAGGIKPRMRLTMA